MKAFSSGVLLATVASTSASCTGVSAHLPTSECSAWQAFFRATGGQSWHLCSNSLYDPCGCSNDIADPYGRGAKATVSCVPDNNTYAPAGAQTITSIALLANNLVGTIPDELGDFKNLEHFQPAFNYLQGPLPYKQLSKLERLNGVELGGNRFSGTIPTGFGAMRQLISFNVDDNSVSEWHSQHR